MRRGSNINSLDFKTQSVKLQKKGIRELKIRRIKPGIRVFKLSGNYKIWNSLENRIERANL